jgi:predicted TIM-barrel fold metal-dependent hydrolase
VIDDWARPEERTVQDGIFVLDGVAHAFDMSPANFANERFAMGLNALQSALFGSQPPGYDLQPEATIRNWTVDETANILFRETYTDVAIFHPVPIYFYKDGLSGFQKALEATKRWPKRFIGSYCAVDPLASDPVGDFEHQFEQLDNPVGLKLYPVGFDSEGNASPWRMDDPKLGFPLYEKCLELGVNSVAIHKSLPLGPAPNGRAFHPEDVEGAALAYPDINFSIVHGGMAFTEETAWLVARFPNIWINMESLNITLMLRPRVFAEMIAGIMSIAGEAAIDRMYWASGAMNCHPRPSLEAFMTFQIPDEVRERVGTFFEIPQITDEHRRKMLGENLARLHNLDIAKLADAIKDDEFSETQGQPLPTPYSTTPLADAVQTPFVEPASRPLSPASPI